jgi:uncharacterized protein YbjQ (UPF0145 family)
MPDEDETQSAEALEREQAESIARLESGRIPLQAERRLREMAASGAPFSSTLSVDEFALCSKLALKPIGQVLGASVHQVGWQNLPWSASWGDGLIFELDVISSAWEEARRLAFGRLAEEARHLKADLVVGVRLHRGSYDWAVGAIDYVVNGTAVRRPGSEGSRTPLLSDLSGQEVWQLHEAGYAPVGLVAATAVFFVSPSYSTQWAQLATNTVNQELTDFTQGIYAAREHALRSLTTQANANRADGIVGVRIEQQTALHSFAAGGFGGRDRQGLLVTLQAFGTAIRGRGAAQGHSPRAALDLGRQPDVGQVTARTRVR